MYCNILSDIAATGPPFAWRQRDAQYRSFRDNDHEGFPIPLTPDSIQQAICGYDQAETQFLVDGFTHGFKIYNFGTPTLNCTDNHPSTSVHRDVVTKKLSNYLLLGGIAGPFLTPPF